MKIDIKTLIVFFVLITPVLEKASTCYTANNSTEFIICEPVDFDPLNNIYEAQLITGSMSW